MENLKIAQGFALSTYL